MQIFDDIMESVKEEVAGCLEDQPNFNKRDFEKVVENVDAAEMVKLNMPTYDNQALDIFSEYVVFSSIHQNTKDVMSEYDDIYSIVRGNIFWVLYDMVYEKLNKYEPSDIDVEECSKCGNFSLNYYDDNGQTLCQVCKEEKESEE